MSKSRFNPVFLSLMLISGLVAFVTPRWFAEKIHGHFQGVFAPVAYPVMRVARAVSGRVGSHGVSTEFDATQAPADARLEIERLQVQVASLTMQVGELRQLNA